jgi:KaiC/GvpD/RAD55 family RecA-like ATPase
MPDGEGKMMQTLKIAVDWLDALLPEGLPLRTSTLLSGPGGSGKPLIGDNFVAAWLRAGGSAVSMSLQYPSADFVHESLKIITGLDLDEYRQRVVFLSLDAALDGMAEPEGNITRANLIKPDVWDAAIERTWDMLPHDDPGILVFGSALNLLLFSPTYGEAILKKMETALRDDKSRSYVFSVSTTAKKKEIDRLEALADNLIMTRSEQQPFRLYMQIVRMKDVPFLGEEIQVPIPPGSLAQVKEIAEHSRKRVIPQISRI